MARAACRFAAQPSGVRHSTIPALRQRIAPSNFKGGYGQIQRFSSAAILREKKYTEDHEWIELSSDGKIRTIEISDYAANALGDVVYVELPESEFEVGAADAMGAVESVKSASDILSPVAGKVKETNKTLEETPGLINQDPEGEGWIAKLELAKGAQAEVGGLMDAAKYKKFTEEAESE